jgi:N-acetylmuramoyl-L-alanine amidase
MRSTFAAASAVALVLVACGEAKTETETVMVPADPAEAATTAAPEEEAPPAAEAGDRECNRIVIDPGHDSRPNPATEPIGPGSRTRKIKDGGGTSGVVTGTPESVVVLQISLRLRRLLRADGYCVTMTRSRQTGVSMGNIDRARIANRARAALFVRIHADGNPDRSRNGTALLYPAQRRGWTDDILPESKVAAQKLQRALVASLGSRDLGIVARSDLTGFNWADVPAVLPELGFMSNPREDRLLGSPRYQRRAARGLRDGIRAFVPPQK